MDEKKATKKIDGRRLNGGPRAGAGRPKVPRKKLRSKRQFYLTDAQFDEVKRFVDELQKRDA